MTVPGGVTSLPAGALTADNMASQLQDMTPDAMHGRAAERVPATYDTSTGGNPLEDLTPFGIITRLFAGFASHVANADPADIQGPEDLPGLLNDFIHELPVVGEFVRLLDALAGTYVGDDPTLLQIQDLFGGVRGGLDKLRQFIESLIGQALDLLHLPSPEQAWQQIMKTFLDPLAWLRNIPVGAISSSTPNLLAEAISNGEGVWVQDASGAFHVTANGTMLELISDRIELDVDRSVDAEVKVKYTGLAAAVGTSPIRLSWIGWATDPSDPTKAAEVAGGDFEVHQPVGASSSGITLDGTLKRLPADNWDSVSIRLTVMPGATAGDLVWSGWRATKPDKLPKNLVDGLESALAAAGQSIRDAICNALGISGTGHTDADVINALTHIPQNAVAGMTALANQVGDGFKAWWNTWFNRTDGTGSVAQVQQVAAAIKAAVANGYTLETEITNGTWAVPSGINELHGITLGAGDCGWVGQTGTGSKLGGARTNGGPYVSRQLDLSVLIPGTAVLTHIVGAAGSTAGALGGISQIKDSAGNVLVDSGHGLGGVALPQGMLATTSSAGYGGKGGDANTSGPTATAGEDGGSSGTATGGAGGQPRIVASGAGSLTGYAGGDGSPGQTSTIPIVGGSGGAGGGGIATNINTWAVRGGDGGDGGWPGGAGGSSGAAAGLLNFSPGNFGLGAPGMVAYLYK